MTKDKLSEIRAEIIDAIIEHRGAVSNKVDIDIRQIHIDELNITIHLSNTGNNVNIHIYDILTILSSDMITENEIAWGTPAFLTADKLINDICNSNAYKKLLLKELLGK